MNAIRTAKQVMKNWNWRKTGIFIVLIVLPLIAATTLTPTALTMQKHVIGGGGGRSEAGSFVLNGTAGQAVAGTASNAPYELGAGFWYGMGRYEIYLPLVLRQS
jgi:hypothetical protein